MAFQIKPEDLGLATAEKVAEKVASKNSTTAYLKNFIETSKIVKSSIKEGLDFLGITPEEAKQIAKQKLLGQQPPQQYYNKNYQQPIKTAEFKTVELPKEQPKKMEKIDFEKTLKKIKLVIKLLKAEEMKVKEFISLVEEQKADIEEILN